MYISFEEYAELYDPADEKVFDHTAYDACRYIDRMTTGVDGVKKLRVAFPTDEDNIESVKRCAAAVTNFLIQIQEAEHSASLGRGYIQTENGLQGKVVSSVSAGNESISFSSVAPKTSIDIAISDPGAKEKMVCEMIREYLSGCSDANGVSLLYMGVYPRV